eukprot:5000922-Pyramimonas_sp.AAC.1
MAAASTCTWEVSEQAARKPATCAKCSTPFETGDLLLRRANTRNTRLIHPGCSHGLVNDTSSIVGFGQLPLATRQRLERSLSHAASAHGLSGDVPQPRLERLPDDPDHVPP